MDKKKVIKKKSGRKRYDDKFKVDALKRMKGGESAADLAKKLKVNINSLYKWKRGTSSAPVRRAGSSKIISNLQAAIKYIKTLEAENKKWTEAKRLLSK